MSLVFAPILKSQLAQGHTADHPPQYVVLAFDGSKSLSMWQETRQFAKDMTAAGRPLKFTYFINAAYYLAENYKKSYIAPGLGAGKSAIGFGGNVSDIRARYDQTNLAFLEGNEIANHAAGHFDGSHWTAVQWKSEFNQFYDILFNVFKFNHTQPTAAFAKGWTFGRDEIIGFRAPQLGLNQAMYSVLPSFGIQYDTSQSTSPNYWPRKNAQGIWNFPLAEVRVAGTSIKTLSMDYNFYYVQSHAKEDPAHGAQFEEQMFQTYMTYFQGNYNGNRAPINIGHHFSKWNGGAYWRAMKRFAQKVCGQPEVKCVTYRDLTKYLNGLDPKRLASFDGDGSSDTEPVDIAALDDSENESDFGLSIKVDLNDEKLFIADPPEAHDE